MFAPNRRGKLTAYSQHACYTHAYIITNFNLALTNDFIRKRSARSPL